MNQITFLPQELVKAADNKADNSSAESSSRDRDDSFSSLVEQHTQADNRSKSDKQTHKSGNSAGNDSGNSVGKNGGKEASPVTETGKGSETADPADKNAEAVASEAEVIDTQAAENGDVAESMEPGTSGKPDSAKDPQHLIDLLGASAKLLQQQVLGESTSDHELSDEVNIKAELKGAGAGESSLLAKFKGAEIPQPTSEKVISASLDGDVSGGENLETEVAEGDVSADQAIKSGNKTQTSSQETELLAKLKAAEGELAAKDKASQVGGGTSDKKLSLEELMAKTPQALKAGLNDKAANISPENLENSESQAADDVVREKPLTDAKPVFTGAENGGKKSIQLNKGLADIARAGGAASTALPTDKAADEVNVDMDSGARESAVATEVGGKNASLQNQAGSIDNHRPLGSAAQHGEQGTGSNEQGKDPGNQSGQQASKDEVLTAKEETSQVQQHKVATTPLRDQSTLATQMNNSALANSETPQAHNSEHVLDSVATKVNAENLQTQKNNLTSLNEALNMRKDFAAPLKEKVMIMVNQKIQQVEIRLDPPELGNMHVRVNLQNEQAAVNFLVQSQQAKEALEQSMGKLKDMLSESGVDVGDANVEQQQQGSGDNEQAFGHDQQGDGRENHGFEQPDLVMQASFDNAADSGVDYYA